MTGRLRLVAQAAAVAVVVALLGLLAWKVTQGEGEVATELAQGGTPAAPEFTLERLDGEGELSLASLRGRPIVLNFWASWCGPCKDEAPALRRAHAKLAQAGGTVIGVTVDDSTPDSQAFVRDFGLPFPSLRDVDGELGEDYGRTGVPETFVIDREGKVAAISRGQVDDEWLDQALPGVL
jgi:cytochrome c biogenesis protein CcmG, thiol:disulfide interchange protein DsbE